MHLLKRPLDMKKRRTLIFVFALLVVSYVGSYGVRTLGGFYNPTVYGLRQGPNNTAIIAPKAWGPYVWNPYSDRPITTYENIDGGALRRLRALHIFYYPLHFVDRKVWHRDADLSTRAEGILGFKYPVKNYFDEAAFTYSDYTPK